MSVKRLAASLGAVIVLLFIAGFLQLLLVITPDDANAIDEPVSSGSTEQLEAQTPKPDDQDQVVADEVRTVSAVRFAVSEVGAGVLSQVDNLVAAGSITIDGAPLDRKLVAALLGPSERYVERIEYIDQREFLRSGCELIALTAVLRAEGFELSPTEIATDYLRMGADAATEYLGSPFESGGGLPPCIAEAGNAWLSAHGSTGHVANLTGSSIDGVLSLVSLGYPVLTWTTEKLREPRYVYPGEEGWGWYMPEHCVVVYGAEGDELIVMDSLEGIARRNRAEFERVYDACGRRALLVIPDWQH